MIRHSSYGRRAIQLRATARQRDQPTNQEAAEPERPLVARLAQQKRNTGMEQIVSPAPVRYSPVGQRPEGPATGRGAARRNYEE